MTAMTPIKCFIVKGLDIYVEDYAGIRTLVCTAPNIIQQAWITSTFEAYHKSKSYDWNEEIGS